MPSITDHLIADYLKRKGYTETLKSFETDSGIKSSIDIVEYEPLEQIVEDRTNYLSHQDIVKKTSSTYNQVENSELFNKWNDITPRIPKDLSNHALTIHISTSKFLINDKLQKVLFVTSSDKSLKLFDLETHDLIGSFSNLHPSVGKCCYAIPNTNRILSCGMDGKLKIFQFIKNEFEFVTDFQIQKRLVTDVKIWVGDDKSVYIYSIGWDQHLKVHKITNDEIQEISAFKLLSNATAIELGKYDSKPIVLLTRLDSSQLAYFTLIENSLYEIVKISLNDAEFSTHGFTPMSISLSSNDLSRKHTFVAVGTSHIPFMRLIVAKVPNLREFLDKIEVKGASKEQSLSTPVLRGYILGNLNTSSPQDKYSQAKIIWRTDRSGVWISGDDGLIRGMDFKSGEIVKILDEGHDQRIKCLINDSIDDKEIVISSAIDKKLIYWS